MKKLVLLILLSPSVSFALEEKDSITISSAYFEGQYSNEQFATFGLELLRAGSRLEDFIVEKSSADIAGVAKWSSRILTFWCYNAFKTAYHETGHGLRARAYGSEYILTKHGDKSGNRKDENFFKYFTKRLTSFSRGACVYIKELSPEEQLVVAAGGMNNEMYFAERISNELHTKKNASVVEGIAYFHSRLSPTLYALKTKSNGDINSSDDPVAVDAYYEKFGISAKKNDIALAGLVSLLASGTTYSMIKMMVGSDKYASPLEFLGFRVPDTFSYVTSKGISYKAISGYKLREDLKLIFGAEHVFHGKSTTEVNLGINKTFDGSLHNMSCEVVTTFGKGVNLEASCSIPVLNCLSINFGGGTYSCKSLLGERHAPNMKNGKGRSSNVFVSVSYKY
jgi:hypothetical protein